MPNHRISDTIVKRMEALILEGSLKPGEKLPAERQLSVQLGVSRPSLREALHKLAARNLVDIHRGGGTYITRHLNRTMEDPLMALIAKSPESHKDVLELRHALESVAAFFAARRRTESDKSTLRETYKQLILSHGKGDTAAEAKADADFHLAIAAASHNQVLIHVTRCMFSIMEKNIGFNLDVLYNQPSVFEQLREQHHSLLSAILRGDQEKARETADRHIAYIEACFLDLGEKQKRQARALRRQGNLADLSHQEDNPSLNL
ncbi:MAG: FCD domain-containing protein [Arenicellales bacterium]|nr:transcriptional regulator PdhR [Acidiferrobacteraceae bacterium]MDP6288643.1 FCD domain-containing protein [Arenicellales bacterium]MDP6435362.1 FCD domain-containing protein [Arenicellales bacterium]MDP6672089.1 FCD domain-containing protein [Arenicellales bacterium]MDP6724945.1 FCD domain-containing protein [Arenicellales bacterium]